MFVDYRGTVFSLLAWQWRNLLLFSLAGGAAVLVHRYAPGFLPRLSPFPLGIMAARLASSSAFAPTRPINAGGRAGSSGAG